MMFFYSGSVSPGGVSNAEQSNGGYISNTLIQNGQLESIFSPVTRLKIQQNSIEYKMIVFQNKSGSDITSLDLWTEVVSDIFELEVGLVAPAFDEKCNKYFFEQIPTPYQPPFQVNFNQHEGESNKVTVTDIIQVDKYIGIWIKRKFKDTLVQEYQDSENPENLQFNCDRTTEEIEEELSSIKKVDNFSLHINYNN